MSPSRYRRWYAALLRFYPRAYRERFAESMEQTFDDLLCERREAGKSSLGFMLWVCGETLAGIARENMRSITPLGKKLAKPVLLVLAPTVILLVIYLANGADDTWYYVSAWIIVLASGIPASTTTGKDER